MKRYIHIAYAQLSDKLGRKSRVLWRNKKERSRLTNENITIFSQNCIGGIMYHDLGLQFCSPTVNLLFTPSEFITFMKDIHHYIEQDIQFIATEESYPVAKLGEVEIRFLHYHSEEEARNAWNVRKSRINWQNMFVICCDEGLSYEEIVEFDNLPYENKILFLHQEVRGISCGIVVKEFTDKTDARLLNFANPMGKRFYQNSIDYVAWLNGEKNYKI